MHGTFGGKANVEKQMATNGNRFYEAQTKTSNRFHVFEDESEYDEGFPKLCKSLKAK